MKKYAVVESFFLRREIRPFGGCFEVVKESDKFIWVRVPKRDGEEETRKTGKKNVWFYCDKDITQLVKDANIEVEDSLNAHEELIKRTAKRLQEAAQ